MTQVGEGVAVTSVPPVDDKEFKAEVISVSFTDSFRAAHNKSQITAPHWPAPLFNGRYSQKAAVYAFGSSAAQKVEVKIKVESKGYSGNGTLIGIGASMEFEGQVPLSSGEHTVVVKLKNPPTELSWLKGSISWGVELADMSASAGTSFVELFFVFKNPSTMPFFTADGVWTEALRFLFLKGRPLGVSSAREALEMVTRTCFSLTNHKYDITSGAPAFGGASGVFFLSQYMSSAIGIVNCYDQAYAVIVFSGALGLVTTGIFINPFGYLATTQLVGWGRCNNPFPARKYASAGRAGSSPWDFLVVRQNDPDRAPFGNHMFCEFAGKIYDACAGPVTGSGDRANYATTAIDISTTLYASFGSRAGTPSDMMSLGTMGRAVRSVI